MTPTPEEERKLLEEFLKWCLECRHHGLYHTTFDAECESDDELITDFLAQRKEKP